MSRRRKLDHTLPLSEIFHDGDRVRLEMLPIEKYRFVNGEETPNAGANTVPLVLQGTFDAVVRDARHDDMEIDVGGIEAWPYREQITHYKILEAAPRPQEAVFGRMRLYMLGELLRVNHCNVRKQDIAQVAHLAGWEYTGGDAAEYFAQVVDSPDYIAHMSYMLDDYELRVGCACATREDLDDALDWVAERLGWL